MARAVTPEYRARVGERMRQTREVLGKSQRALAAEIGVNSNRWNQYETGERLIDPITLGKWARLDRFPLDWIYLGDAKDLRHEIASKVSIASDPELQSPSSAKRAKQNAAR